MRSDVEEMHARLDKLWLSLVIGYSAFAAIVLIFGMWAEFDILAVFTTASLALVPWIYNAVRTQIEISLVNRHTKRQQ